MFNDGAVYIHDLCESNLEHSYSQIFNIGPDVEFGHDQNGNLILSSQIDETSLTLNQLNTVNGFMTFYGSTEPIMGWQSTTFNEVSPINAIAYYMDGDNVEFSTIINLEYAINSVSYSNSDTSEIYTFEFDNSNTIAVEM